MECEINSVYSFLNASTISWLCVCAFDGVKKRDFCYLDFKLVAIILFFPVNHVENICTGNFLTVDNTFFYPPDLTVKQFS